MQTILRFYIKRIKELGIKQSLFRAIHKAREQYIKWYWWYKAYYGIAAHGWDDIAAKHYQWHQFTAFFDALKKQKLSFLDDLYADRIDQNGLIQEAQHYAHNCFSVLGSHPQCFTRIPWHEDFRLKQQNPSADTLFDPGVFYQNRSLFQYKNAQDPNEIKKDIKVPWELSRCHHFFVFGKAYQYTSDTIYLDAFVRHIVDWMDANPYLFGVNWMCPMEVGIRSINWIIGLQFFDKNLPEEVMRRIVCCLYDHMIYLEHHWELYDGRTSNHYLSNLIGYFYLCWFFEELAGVHKNLMWCYQELLREWDKQVFAEGADYEGSTAYHRLVTEIFYLFYLLCNESNIPLAEQYKDKLVRMFDFIEWCTPNQSSMMIIGDDDSGNILYYGLPESRLLHTKKIIKNGQRTTICKQYKEFGLSIIKTKQWHVTLRQHAYQNRQPNGHYHADVGSVTVTYNSIPLFVDGGSYLYTPSLYWRNYFRSYRNHNTFFLASHDPITLDDNFFMIALAENKLADELIMNDHEIVVRHDLYKKNSLQAMRTIHLDENNNRIIITDGWDTVQADGAYVSQQEWLTCWNFMVNSSLVAQKENNDIKLFLHDTLCAKLSSSSLKLELSDGWIVLAYGVKKRCYRISAQRNMTLLDRTTLVIQGNKNI